MLLYSLILIIIIWFGTGSLVLWPIVILMGQQQLVQSNQMGHQIERKSVVFERVKYFGHIVELKYYMPWLTECASLGVLKKKHCGKLTNIPYSSNFFSHCNQTQKLSARIRSASLMEGNFSHASMLSDICLIYVLARYVMVFQVLSPILPVTWLIFI